MSSLYIHIPFCLSKCYYCSFVSYPDQSEIHDRYVNALVKEIENRAAQKKVDSLSTIFLGGGTPTVLSTDNLGRIISTIHSCFTIDKEVEFSIEANPETVNHEMLQELRHQGINRISFGVQSFGDDQLKSLGRVHTGAGAKRAVLQAYECGFSNINVDLMYGIPGQDVDQHRQNLQQVFELPITHLSIYELTIEKATAFGLQLAQGKLNLVGEKEIVAMDEMTAMLSEEAGFYRYEISNYAQDDLFCRHNVIYWQNREYFGIGVAAVSYVDGRRMKNDPDPAGYCRKIETGSSTVIESEQLSWERSLRESIIMGLRLVEGVSRKMISDRYGLDVIEFYGKVVGKLKKEELLNWNKTHLFLTDKGLRYANRVMAELV